MNTAFMTKHDKNLNLKTTCYCFSWLKAAFKLHFREAVSAMNEICCMIHSVFFFYLFHIIATKVPKCISMFTGRPLVHPAPTLVQSQRRGGRRVKPAPPPSTLFRSRDASLRRWWKFRLPRSEAPPTETKTSRTPRAASPLQRCRFGLTVPRLRRPGE